MMEVLHLASFSSLLMTFDVDCTRAVPIVHLAVCKDIYEVKHKSIFQLSSRQEFIWVAKLQLCIPVSHRFESKTGKIKHDN